MTGLVANTDIKHIQVIGVKILEGKIRNWLEYIWCLVWDNLMSVLFLMFVQIPKLKNYKPVITSLLCASCYVISLPCVSSSGQTTSYNSNNENVYINLGYKLTTSKNVDSNWNSGHDLLYELAFLVPTFFWLLRLKLYVLKYIYISNIANPCHINQGKRFPIFLSQWLYTLVILLEHNICVQ